jgi:DNA-binding NarL/FixJ family response regulator
MIQSFVMGKIKLALLDANIVYLAALTDFLSSREEFEVVAEGCDIYELLDSLEAETADILIADAEFLDGDDLLSLLGPFQRNPDMRLLIMGFDLPEQWLRERRDDAQVSFLSKDCDHSQLGNRLVYIGSYCGSRYRGY